MYTLMFRTEVHSDSAIVGPFIEVVKTLPTVPEAQGELVGAINGTMVTLQERPVGFQPTLLRGEARLTTEALDVLDTTLRTDHVLRYLYPQGAVGSLALRTTQSGEQPLARLELSSETTPTAIEASADPDGLTVKAVLPYELLGFKRAVDKLLLPESLISASRYLVDLVRTVADSQHAAL